MKEFSTILLFVTVILLHVTVIMSSSNWFLKFKQPQKWHWLLQTSSNLRTLLFITITVMYDSMLQHDKIDF